MTGASGAGDRRDIESLVNAVGGVVWEYDWEAERFTFVSEGAEALLGYPAEQWLERDFWSDHAHPDDLLHVREFTESSTVRGEAHELTYRMMHQNGSIVWVKEIVRVGKMDRGALRQYGITIDITAQKSAEEALEHSKRRYHDRLSKLTVALVDAEDRERRRLAEELHDRVSQALAVARMHLGAAVDRNDLSEARESIRLLDEAIRQARNITSELSPPVLYELGLGPAVFWLAEQFKNTHGLNCEVFVGEDVSADETTSATMFRATRELLADIVRRGGNAPVYVSLDRVREGLVLTVEDRGGRATADELDTDDAGADFGLFSIRERMQHVGGTFDFEADPSFGTRVTITLPA